MDGQKKVLITGADGGLGIAVVTRFLHDGWKVYAFLHNTSSVGKMQQHFSGQFGNQLSFLIGDVTDISDIEKALKEMKLPDALVHLAGGFKGAPTYADHDPQVFDQMFELNTRSTFLLLRAILPMMKENKSGAIVTIGAKPAVHPGAENAVYAASKAALISLTLTAAEEGRMHHVRANVIVPAVIRTEANAKWASSEKEMEKWTPPEDIARVVFWLVSEQGSSVTGTVIPMYHQMKT